MRPHPRQPGKLVFQLRHLHLQLPLRGPRALAEYVKDQHRAVAHLHLAVEELFDVAVLPRGELGVEYHRVHRRFRALVSHSQQPPSSFSFLVVQRAFVLVRPLLAPRVVRVLRSHVFEGINQGFVRPISRVVVLQVPVFDLVDDEVVFCLGCLSVWEPAEPAKLPHLPLADVRARVRVLHALRQGGDDLEPRALRQLREFGE